MSDAPVSPVMLMIAERFPPDLGGVARSAARTAQAISRLGWNVHVLAWTKTLQPGVLETVKASVPSDSNADVTVHRLGLFANSDLSMQHTTNVLEWLHRQFEFSAVWGHYVYPAGYMGVVFAESCGLPSTVSARGNDIDRLMFPPGDFARLIWTLQRASVVSCVSEDLAKKVGVLLGRRSGIVVVPNVVDTELFCPGTDGGGDGLRSSLGIQPEEAVLGFCGELRHKKGLPFILSALLEVNRERPACLLVIGEVRPREQTHLANFTAEHPEIASRIRVTGRLDQQSEVVRYLQLCDVVLQPSVWDGLPNAILEAMACGKIVIASDAGGIPEAIVHGVSGFLIQKALLNNLGEAILEVLSMDAAQREAMSTAARQHVVDCFHDQIEAAALGDVLQALSDQPTGSPSKSS